MTKPTVKFRISAKRDFETIQLFSREAKYDDGRNLKWVVKKHPQLLKYFDKDKMYQIENKKKLVDFVSQEYHEKGEAITNGLSLYRKQWEEISDNYFLLVDELSTTRIATKRAIKKMRNQLKRVVGLPRTQGNN